jgi:uncharacterized protein (DUF58 family)
VLSRFPLGLMERSFELGQVEQLIVYPRVGRLKAGWRRTADRGETVAEHVPVRAGTGDDEFHRLREYRGGDNPRDIHWRTTARRNELMVREFQPNRRQNLLLVVDLWLPPAPQSADLERVELAISFAATICVDQVDAGTESGVDLVLCGDRTSQGSGLEGSIGGLLEQLALVKAGPATDLAAALREATQTALTRQRKVLVTTRAAAAVRPAIESAVPAESNGPDLAFEIIEADPRNLVEYLEFPAPRSTTGVSA